MKDLLIALDIDGTLTADLHEVPKVVETYLEQLVQSGATVALITGRCFSLAYPPLKKWAFPYLLALHNGAVILQMPEKNIIASKSINPAVLDVIEAIASEEDTDFALYTGIENEDRCYFRPQRYPLQMRKYLEERAKWCGENWIAVDHFDKIPLNSLAAVKFFSDEAAAKRIQARIQAALSLHVPVITDPFDRTVFIAQATEQGVNKGSAVETIINGKPHFVVAAGDDFNDLPMLENADVKIVMATAPEELKKLATIIARPARECGIIEALENARKDWI